MNSSYCTYIYCDLQYGNENKHGSGPLKRVECRMGVGRSIMQLSRKHRSTPVT